MMPYQLCKVYSFDPIVYFAIHFAFDFHFRYHNFTACVDLTFISISTVHRVFKHFQCMPAWDPMRFSKHPSVRQRLLRR